MLSVALASGQFHFQLLIAASLITACVSQGGAQTVPRTQASRLPQTWDSRDVPFEIDAIVEPPSAVASIIVSSDWWMKRPKDMEIYLVDIDSTSTWVATAEFTRSLDICGMNGDERCNYPYTPTSMMTIDIESDIIASAVRVVVLTPQNEPGTGNDMVIISDVTAVTVGHTTTTAPTGNVLFEIFSGGANCGEVPELDDRVVIHTAEVPEINLPSTSGNKPNIYGFQTGSNWVARFSASLQVISAGNYTFTLGLGDADTGALWVDGIAVARSSCNWGQNGVTGSVFLSTGFHSIRVLYSDDGWTDRVVLSYDGPDTEFLTIVVPSGRLVVDNSAVDEPEVAASSTTTRGPNSVHSSESVSLSASTVPSVTHASQLPRTWDARDAPFQIDALVEPPSAVASIIVASDWWMKRPKDLEIFLVDSNSNNVTRIASFEYPTSLDICGMSGNELCNYPYTPTSWVAIDVMSDIVASAVRVVVLTPRNEPGTGNDMVIISEVAVVAVGQTTTALPLGNVLVEIFSGGVNCGEIPEMADRVVVHVAEVPEINLPVSSVNNPNVYGFQTGNNWVARFSAALEVLSPGNYTFTLGLGDADTGGVWIDGIAVAQSSCNWGSNGVSGNASLSVGLHSIRVLFADDGWTDRVVLSYSGPDTDFATTIVPASSLSADNSTIDEPDELDDFPIDASTDNSSSASLSRSTRSVRASHLPQTWESSDVPFEIEAVVEPPAVVASVIVVSDWWMKRPKDLEIFVVDNNLSATRVATVEYPDSISICGMNGDERCNYPYTPTSRIVIDIESDVVASAVRVAVLTPMNEPGIGNDQVIISEVSVVAVGHTTTTAPSGNVLVELFSGGVDCGDIPELADREVVHTVQVPEINIPASNANNPRIYGFQTGNNWVARFSASLEVISQGDYTFTLGLGDADTGGVWVDGVAVARSSCNWGQNVTGNVVLSVGFHSIKVLYADDGWTDRVVLSYSGPDTGLATVVVPSTRLMPDTNSQHVPSSGLAEVEVVEEGPSAGPSAEEGSTTAPGEEWMAIKGSLAFSWSGSPEDFEQITAAVTEAVAALLDVNEDWVEVQIMSNEPDVVARRRLQDESLEVTYVVTVPAQQAEEFQAVLLQQTVEDFQVALDQGLASQGLELDISVTSFASPTITSVSAPVDWINNSTFDDDETHEEESDWASQAPRFAASSCWSRHTALAFLVAAVFRA